MAEIDPAVLAERVLRLKSAGPFESVDLGDLAIIAAIGREVLVPNRTRLVADGERATAHWVPLTGALWASRHGEPVPGNPAAGGFGGLSVLSGRPAPCDVFADAGSVLLVLESDALMAILEERGRVARAVLHAMARSALRSGVAAEPRGGGPYVLPARSRPPALDLVSRMVVLRKAVALGSRNGSALVRLARAARPERVPEGQGLWPDESRPADLVIVLDGALDAPPRWQRDQTPDSAVYGLMEALGSMPPERPVVAVRECVTLVVRHAEIHEAVEDDDRTCLELIRLVALEHWRGFWEAHPRPRAGPDASTPLRALPT